MNPSKHPRPAPLTTPTKVDSIHPSDITNMHLHDMPDIRPCNTTSPSDTRQAFDPLKLHRIFGCCWFRNPNHINSAADNATLIETIEPPTTLGALATTPKSNKGKSKLPHHHFLDKVYGNCTSMGGYHY